MAIIYIDHIAYDVKPGKNLLETCLSLGFNLPYFCWHPAMGSVGACRQCAIKLFKDEEDTKGRIVMSCMETVKDNIYLSINDPTATAFRAQIIEWLMTNHPHDCAVCDEGGSCHLQDMTVMTGHAYRRFNYQKRTYKNQDLGPFINHEMNRCIHCYRCVRFYKDYAGGKDLDAFATHNHVYFGRTTDGILENEFSGNLAEVCPTGVFTDKTLKEHYTRKWDLTMAPSICQHCSLGCNIIGGERYGELRQITNRYNAEVNGYFICDRGRFGYEFVNNINRIQQPLIRSNIPEAIDKQSLHHHLKALLSNNKVIGIASPRASLESNFALMQLVGKENFYQGISETEAQLMRTTLHIVNSGHIHTPTLKETETADVILILGEDLTNAAPMLALAIRQAAHKKGLIFTAYPTQTKLDELASKNHYLVPDEIARLGFAIANVLNETAPAPIKMKREGLKDAQHIANMLKKAERPLIICGTSLYNEAILKAAANIAYALATEDKKASLCFVVQECNSMGLAMMEAPSLNQAAEVLKNGKADTVIILENDLYRRTNKKDIDDFFDSCKQVVVLDHLHNETTNKANTLIPVGTFAEANGTIINNEGRAQHFFQVFVPKNENLRESWRWLDEFRQFKMGTNLEALTDPGNLLAKMAKLMPQFKGVETAMPATNFRIDGQKIPREPHRYSGRTAMLANINVSEPKPPEDPDSALSFTMEGYKGIPPAPLTPFFWAPGWNSGQSVNKYQIEIGGPLKGEDQGKRLFPEISSNKNTFLNNVPQPFKSLPDEWLIVPLQHIFGSEELSIYTQGVSERTPQPYIAINKHDAENLNTRENEILQILINDQNYKLRVNIKEELPNGLAGIPYHIPGLTGISWPAKGIIKKTTK
ncbi:MAG: NADH-quinone oxidoreductase subunit NuoG [Candidatus Pedobacter colombiensis]|uniref:NADH-quinone oxidoreductase subunit G n=1 Tax=Candidatus Pedobacter colombiensis TaxID=3121371 RepID=A0AAJ5WAS8_9SPHI|nr:NADH-quinone oxidoreductase subunit NuoG [Pedobacter sp.]WEK21157.1 MAG: NADH-quinone oxidoreductase subunit NuoG [Pedobacter sp.]